jgi:hypothetical protein
MWIQLGADYLNLDNLAAVHFGRTGNGDLLATVETTAGLIRRYQGENALTLREAMQALCCHAVAEECLAGR